MLRIFRNLRKNLLSGGNTNRYFKYALGEVLLIMVGILFALQINNWNENRKERNQEKTFLNQLQEDFDKDLNQLRGKKEMTINILKSIEDILAGIDDPDSEKRKNIHQDLTKLFAAPTFDPITSYLSQTHMVSIISDEDLKRKLTTWTSDYIQLIDSEKTWKDFRDNYLIVYLIPNHSLRNTMSYLWKERSIKMGLLDENEKESISTFSPSISPQDDYEVFELEELEDYLSHPYTINKIALLQAESLEKRIVEIMELIEKNI